jgi:hypothetical protein
VKLLLVLSFVLLAGCTVVSHLSPYVAPAKILYCAAVTPDERQWIREQYGLPQMIWCASDFTAEQVQQALEDLENEL